MSKIIGIDLGTTNSLAAVVLEGTPQIIPDGEQHLVPSVVGLSSNGEILVGQAAKNQYVLYPNSTVKSIKRKMGSEKKVLLGKDEYLPQEISAFILKKLKKNAEKYLGEAVEKAVITVPAYFNDAQRQATKDAGEIAGLEVVRIINEPTAAALVYGLDKEEEQVAMVYDLGGGTFDVSIVEINSGVVEVRASHGNNQLGGDDFDRLLVDHLVKNFMEKYNIDLEDDSKALARLFKAGESAKIHLSDYPFAAIAEEFIAKKRFKALHLKKELSREDFNSMIHSLVYSTVDSIEIALNDAGLKPADVHKILMVGGSTRIPLVWDVVEEKMGRQPHAEIDPEECVAMGAAIQGAIIAGEDVDAVLVDVTPYSIGIETAEFKFGNIYDDRYSIIIKKNTVIPVSKSEAYYTMHPEQTSAEVKVYQGEKKTASDNILLGSFTFDNIPISKTEEPAEFIIQFDLDVNGILHVSATHKDSGRKEGISVKTSQIKLSDEEKLNAKDKLSSLEISEQDIAFPLLNKAESLLRNLDDIVEREELDRLVQKVRTTAREDEKAFEQSKEELLQKLFELE
ncbi:MAG: Hsp70 family protein [Calditrichaeota bacterium]|nr:Hsp70 family protein [Calditrichota bacterium]